MPKVKVGDIHIAYREYGQGEPSIIMINGLGGAMQNYIDNPGLVEAFAARHHTVIFDNRGAGETDVGEIEDVTIALMAKDTIGLMDALGIDKAIIAGGSMGGMIAQQMACDYPDRVAKLILISTWPGGPKTTWPSPELTLYLTTPGFGDTGSLKTINPLRLVFSQETMEEMGDEALADIAEQFFTVRQTQDIGFARQQVALGKFDCYDRLHEIKVPVLILNGRHDCLIPPDNGVKMAYEIPNAKFILLPNSSHATIEDADMIAAECTAFVDAA